MGSLPYAWFGLVYIPRTVNENAGSKLSMLGHILRIPGRSGRAPDTTDYYATCSLRGQAVNDDAGDFVSRPPKVEAARELQK